MTIGLKAAVAALLLTTGGSLFAQPMPGQPVQAREVAPGLVLLTGGGANSLLRKTPAGSILIDTKFGKQPVFDQLSAAIKAAGGEPVRYVVATHYHGDHTGNDARFQQQGAKVVAQAGFTRELAHFVAPPYDPSEKPASAPDIMFDKTRDLALGGVKVRLLHFAAGHTGSDTLVYFPDLKILALGDELAASPLLDYVGGGSIRGWIASLDQALKLDWTVALPGHGEPQTRADVVALRDKLQLFLDRARAQVKQGVPKEKLLAAIDTEGLWKLNPAFWSSPATIDGLYAEASR